MLLGHFFSVPLQAGTVPNPEDVYRIGLRAYIYGYPLVLMEKTRQVSIQRFPMNRFSPRRRFPSGYSQDGSQTQYRYLVFQCLA